MSRRLLTVAERIEARSAAEGKGGAGPANGRAGRAPQEAEYEGDHVHVDADPWEPAIPLADAPAAPFPLKALPHALAVYCKELALALPAPVDLVAVPALACAAAAIGNARALRVKAGWVERPILWCAVVADTGAKKSPALAAVSRPLRDRQRQLKQQYEEAQQRHEFALAAWKADRAADKGREPAAPKMGQMFTTDATPESLAGLLEDNPRGLLLMQDELTGWATGQNQYKRGGRGNDRQFWLSLWSGAEILVNRAGSRGKPTSYVTDPCCSVVGCLPPAVVGQLHDDRHREDGFVHRILFAWPEAAPGGWSDYEPHPDVARVYDELFARLLGLEPALDPAAGGPRPRLLGWTPAGRRRWVEFVEALAAERRQADFPEDLRGPWAKLEGYGARLALVLHACRLAGEETAEENVDDVSIAKAAELVDYFKAHARRVYPRLAGDLHAELLRDMEAVLGWVRRNRAKVEPAAGNKPPGAFGWSMVRRDLHSRFEGRDAALRLALSSLEARGYLREVPRQRGPVGRPPMPDYFVLPGVWKGDGQQVAVRECNNGKGGAPA